MSRPLFARSSLLLLASVLSLAFASASAPSTQANDDFSAERGQRYIDEGRYDLAICEFTGLIENDPTDVEGYRGRIEAELLLGQYSNAMRDNALITAFVMPVDPTARDLILAGYAQRLASSPKNIPTLTGASFSHWTSFDYDGALVHLKRILAVQPKNLFGNLFRGSARLLNHIETAQGVADLDYAIKLAPKSPDVRFIVADAYTYGLPDPDRAFAEATRALRWGLDTPRIHAILAVCYAAFGDQLAAADETAKHIDLVTTALVPTNRLNAGKTKSLQLVPGRTYEIPIVATAGQTISIRTDSPDFYDTILVLLAPNDQPILGSDDFLDYFAGFDWTAPTTGTYYLLVTSFESIDTGELIVTRN